MTDAAAPHVTALYRYPVKGLTPEQLGEVHLAPGQTVPGDRIYAVENGAGRFNPDEPKHLPKINFLMLMRNERLATLDTHFEDETQTLTILRDGKQVARGQLSTKLGRSMIEQFLAAYMKADLRGAPHIVTAPGHAFTDKAEKCVHIINLASVRELERISGRSIDPLRFRPNIIVDGLPVWSELNLVDKAITIGPVRLEVFTRTQRCDATNVDPATGTRDMAIPALLQRTLEHTDFGVYATVTSPGTIRPGDAVSDG
ncbi:MAG TPA: MOSC domain-containing protein [Hyphomicrobiaceae bacterium]|nr:MOSC domain-containing protein [Hyphomicrobiaceae bacterium]